MEHRVYAEYMVTVYRARLTLQVGSGISSVSW